MCDRDNSKPIKQKILDVYSGKFNFCQKALKGTAIGSILRKRKTSGNSPTGFNMGRNLDRNSRRNGKYY